MVVKHVFPDGGRLHGPPYTQAEQDEFYSRVGRGPVTVARPAVTSSGPHRRRQTQSGSVAVMSNKQSAKKRSDPL